MVGVGISIVEPLVFPLTFSLAHMFDTVFFIHLGRFSPFYNIANVNSWVHSDEAIRWLDSPFQQFNTIPPCG